MSPASWHCPAGDFQASFLTPSCSKLTGCALNACLLLIYLVYFGVQASSGLSPWDRARDGPLTYGRPSRARPLLALVTKAHPVEPFPHLRVLGS